jgi:sucrose-6-phosphate hydrolase SacC (GH32 family)
MTALARSTFIIDGDIDLKKWVKHPTPITVQEKDLEVMDGGSVWYGEYRDPFVWKEGELWYQLVGSGIRRGEDYVGGTALLYTSTDLIHWTYRKPLYIGNYATHPRTGPMWELPVFLPLGKNQNGEEKHILLINPSYASYNEHNVKYVWYWIGTWDKESYSFIPDDEEPQLTDVGEHFTGPSGMIDPKGRRLLFSIAQGKRTLQDEYDSGWAHNAGLPVQLYLRNDGQLGIEPIEELHSLRKEELVNIEGNITMDEANRVLESVRGDVLEIQLELEHGSFLEAGLKVRRSPDGEEETLFYYNMATKEWLVDRTRSSLADDVGKGVQGGRVDLGDEHMKLHLYLDRSMAEGYLNGLKGLTTRLYPTREDALGLQLWSASESERLRVRALKVWQLASVY